MYTGSVAGDDLAFDWDEANVQHLALHRLKPAQIEEFFRTDPMITDHDILDGEERWTALGVTRSARALVVIFTLRDNRIRPITGWRADKRTAARFFRRRGQPS